MKRKIGISTMVILSGVVAAILYFELGPYDIRINPAPALSAPLNPHQEKETTIRNLSDKTVYYVIKPAHSKEEPVQRSLEVAHVDRLPGDDDVEISFWHGGEMMSYTLYSRLAYSFRYDEDGRLDLYRGSHGRSDAADLAPYVPSPGDVVEKMLELAGVNRKDVVYDLGCGDGRIVIAAAKRHGARGVGIDLDPERIEEAASGARKAGVESRVSFRLEDVMKSDFSGATVVTLYLLPESNALLRPLLEKQLKPGTRVVSHNYSIPGWEDKEAGFISFKAEDGEEHEIYLYRR